MDNNSSILTFIALLIVICSVSCVLSRVFNCETNENRIENRIENIETQNDDIPPRYEDIDSEGTSNVITNYDTMIHR